MSFSTLIWCTFVFWSILYYCHFRLSRKRQRQRHISVLPANANQAQSNGLLRLRYYGNSILVTLQTLHVRLETNLANDAHHALIDTLCEYLVLKSAAALMYNIGIVVGAIGLIFGTTLLAANAIRIVGRVLLEVSTDAAFVAMDQFEKRDAGSPVTWSSRGGSLDIYAIVSLAFCYWDVPALMSVQVPGVTVPWSHFPLIIFTLLVAQIIHEAGHFVSAALWVGSCLLEVGFAEIYVLRDTIPVDSVGIALTVILPTAFVAFSGIPSDKDKKSQLRVIAAGAWHNLLTWALLYLFIWSGIERTWTFIGYHDISDRGVAVVDVESVCSHIYDTLLVSNDRPVLLGIPVIPYGRW